LKIHGIDLKDLKGVDYDHPWGIGSGAGAIFGASGGVMEAALRTAYEIVVG
jgi:iron only hydrogenase large subunit-like protein